MLSNCPHTLLSRIDFSDGGQLDTCCWSELGLLSSLALSVFMAHKVTADEQHVLHPCDIINTNDNSRTSDACICISFTMYAVMFVLGP